MLARLTMPYEPRNRKDDELRAVSPSPAERALLDPLPASVWRQRVVWVDERGRRVPLASMTGSALADAIEFCLRNAEQVRVLLLFDALAEASALRLAGADGAARRWSVEALGIALVDGLTLVEQTPLLQELRSERALLAGTDQAHR